MKRASVVPTLLSVILLAAIAICPMIGIVTITPDKLLTGGDSGFIFWTIRVPRVLAALFAGGGLAVAGMIYQAIFRNPLADPYTLGVSSGASLGAALCILVGAGGAAVGMPVIAVGAFVGSVGTIFVIYAFAWSKESNSNTLLLAGVVVTTLCSGLIMFIHLMCGVHQSFQIVRWLMGGVDGVNYSMLSVMMAPIVVFLSATGVFMPQLDQFLTGENIAHSRGVNIQWSRNFFMTATALAVGIIVAVCGPISFIGIIAPHTCRMLIPGIRHRGLAVCSFMLGGSFLIVADTLARRLAPPTEIPVGIITALVGGPFFLILLFRRRSGLLM